MDQKTEDGEQRTDDRGPEALKPCPFCGAVASTDELDQDVWWSICCGCSSTTGVYRTEDEAVEAWNRRAETSVRTEFGQILAGLKARGVITQEDIDRLERDGMKEAEYAG